MRKKALTYLLCAGMAVSLVACGGNSDEEKNNDATPTPAQQDENNTPDDTPDTTPDDTPDTTPDDTPDTTPDTTPDDTPDEEDTVVAGPVAIRVEAESYEQGEGVSKEGEGLGGLNTSAWAMYTVDLKDGGYSQMAIRYGADSVGGTVTLWWGDEDFRDFGSELGKAEFPGTGSWDMNSTVTIDVPNLGTYTGEQTLVVEWNSPDGTSDYLMNPDWIEFYKVSGAGDKVASWNYFDNDFSANAAAGLRGPNEQTTTHIYTSGGCNTAYKLNFGDVGGYNAIALLGDFVGDCEVEIHLGSADGQLVGSESFNISNDWNDAIIQRNVHVVSVPDAAGVTGIQDVYLVTKSGDYNLAGFYFFVDNGQPFTKLSERVEAESRLFGSTSADAGSEGNPITDNNGNIGGTQEGKFNVYRLDFEDGGYNKMTVRYGTWGNNDGTIDIRYGSPDGELIATITIDTINNVPADAFAGDDETPAFANGWTTWATYEIDVPELAGITGEQYICTVFHPRQNNGWVGNIDYYEFSK